MEIAGIGVIGPMRIKIFGSIWGLLYPPPNEGSKGTPTPIHLDREMGNANQIGAR